MQPIGTSSPPAAGASSRRADTLMIVALASANLAEGILLGVMPTAVGGLGELFHQSAGELTWVHAVQLLAAGMSVPVLARLGDIYGHRRILRLGVVLALLGSLLCAVAPNYLVFLVGRALAGPVAAYTALSVGIIRDRAAPERLRSGVSMVMAALTGGSVLGTLAAAQISSMTDNVIAVLWIPVVMFVLTLVVLFTMVPESLNRAHVRPDWWGAVLLSLGLACLLLFVGEGGDWGWTSTPTLGCLAGAVVILTGWALLELRITDPMVDLRVASRRNVAPFYVASLTMGVTFYGAQTAVSTFLATPEEVGYGFGLDVTGLALALVPPGVMAVVGALSVPYLSRSLGHKQTLYCGYVLLVAGYLTLVVWHASLWQAVLAVSIAYYGTGISTGAMPMILAERAARTSSGIATGLFNTVKSVGGSTASASFGAIMTSLTIVGTVVPTEHAYRVVWMICAGAALVSMLIVFTAVGTGKEAGALEDGTAREREPAAA
ncbi:MFS transporter [Streptomyces avicenniae]|uniref:MFS transporter n=1 Tax=Streptomyces avicenniae TaxID=500153 RepID=UPI00069AF7EC|nr:MFS transporter [Streptomyces avicenniae]